LELHSIGPSYSADLEESGFSDNGPNVHRPILIENGVLRGVRMVSSRDGFRRLAERPGRAREETGIPGTD
jgi:hypothetical protein